jgi:hypothetical protein
MINWTDWGLCIRVRAGTFFYIQVIIQIGPFSKTGNFFKRVKTSPRGFKNAN